ncbi:MAG: response regulator [Mycobacteriales bacterium]
MPTVVIADDSPTMRRIVTSVLSREGYEVVGVEDGVAAVQAVFRLQPEAVILDVQMPRVSGYVAARLLKDDWQTAEIPVIMLTSLGSASDRYWATQTGADRYLTKDFQAPELAAAVSEAVVAAQARRGDRPALRPDPLQLSDDDVLCRICDLLDRKLFETSVAAEVTALAASRHGYDQTVAALLELLSHLVDYDLAGVLLVEERSCYLTVTREASTRHYEQFLSATAEAAAAASGNPVRLEDVEVTLADPDSLVGEEDEAPMATFLSMPLRGHGGKVMGLLALSSGTKSAFGETALATLRLVDGPASVVIDNARLFSARVS